MASKGVGSCACKRGPVPVIVIGDARKTRYEMISRSTQCLPRRRCSRSHKSGRGYLTLSLSAVCLSFALFLRTPAAVAQPDPNPPDVTRLQTLGNSVYVESLPDTTVTDVTGYLIPLGAIQKIRGKWAPEASERQSGADCRSRRSIFCFFWMRACHDPTNGHFESPRRLLAFATRSVTHLML